MNVFDPGVGLFLTLSDFQAWFFVYSASTSSGASLDRRIRGSRSGLVLSQKKKHRRQLQKAAQKMNTKGIWVTDCVTFK